ncbi:hypothetical protein [uncultured Marivirga sp.]|uniref:hypothetical protein n=1 Tax=uncultured Marivirga sp. TaxID=1123707 RepID=UPI0030ED5397|tara:strand:- start:58507 stop:58746 length:240 start_codon:yes stop_codon:yes gene_type:complete
MNRLFKITVAALFSGMLFFDGNQIVNAQAENPCAQISRCAAAGTIMRIGDYPMDFLVCPWPEGSSICCVSCKESLNPGD